MTDSRPFDFFISYSSKDEDVTNKICKILDGESFNYWIAPRNIRSGEDYAAEIIRGLDSSKCILLILSDNSNNSEQVLREVERAADKKLPVIVLNIAKVENLSKSLEYFITHRQWITAYDKSNNEKVNYSDVRNSLKQIKDFVLASEFERSQRVEMLTAKSYAGSFKRRNVLIFLLVLLVLSVTISLFFSSYKDRPLNKSFINEGDYVTFGSFRGEKLLWQVLKNDNGLITLITTKPVAFKPFDHAHSGKFSYYSDLTRRDAKFFSYDLTLAEYINNVNASSQKEHELTEAYGSNKWEDSFLRQWLNSDSLKPVYSYGIPNVDSIDSSVWNFYGDYSPKQLKEPGFLFEFSKQELAQIHKSKITTQHLSYINDSCNIFGEDAEQKTLNELLKNFGIITDLYKNDFSLCPQSVTEDLVRIPDKDDLLILLNSNIIELDYSSDLKNKDGSPATIYSYWTPNKLTWWLRNDCGFNNHSVCGVNGSATKTASARIVMPINNQFSGVVPEITIDINENIGFFGKGTANEPFRVKWK